jgi:hypothetical protein
MAFFQLLSLCLIAALLTQLDAASVIIGKSALPSSSESREYEAYPIYNIARRFDLQFQSPETYSFDGGVESPQLRKRNNAEVVNHILKNFGGIDRLSEVGK